MKYYEIAQELEALLNDIELNEGEVSDEQMTALDKLEMAKDEKITNLIWAYQQEKTNLQGIKARMDALTAKKKSTEKRMDFLKYAVSILTQGNKWSNGSETVSYRSSKALEIVDEGNVPSQFIDLKPVIKKAEIKKFIEEGNNVDWAQIKENTNIQIR